MSKSLYMQFYQKIPLRAEKHFTMVQNDHLKEKRNQKTAKHKYRQNDQTDRVCFESWQISSKLSGFWGDFEAVKISYETICFSLQQYKAPTSQVCGLRGIERLSQQSTTLHQFWSTGNQLQFFFFCSKLILNINERDIMLLKCSL